MAFLTDLHLTNDLMHLILANEISDRMVGEHDFAHHDPSLLVGSSNQLLTDNRFQNEAQLTSHHILLMRGEKIDDTVNRLNRVIRMERRKHQVSSFCDSERGLHRDEISNLPD